MLNDLIFVNGYIGYKYGYKVSVKVSILVFGECKEFLQYFRDVFGKYVFKKK